MGTATAESGWEMTYWKAEILLQQGLPARSGGDQQEDFWDVYRGLANVGFITLPGWFQACLAVPAGQLGTAHTPTAPSALHPSQARPLTWCPMSASLDSAPHSYWALGHEFHLSLIISS